MTRDSGSADHAGATATDEDYSELSDSDAPKLLGGSGAPKTTPLKSDFQNAVDKWLKNDTPSKASASLMQKNEVGLRGRRSAEEVPPKLITVRLHKVAPGLV